MFLYFHDVICGRPFQKIWLLLFSETTKVRAEQAIKDVVQTNPASLIIGEPYQVQIILHHVLQQSMGEGSKMLPYFWSILTILCYFHSPLFNKGSLCFNTFSSEKNRQKFT